MGDIDVAAANPHVFSTYYGINCQSLGPFLIRTPRLAHVPTRRVLLHTQHILAQFTDGMMVDGAPNEFVANMFLTFPPHLHDNRRQDVCKPNGQYIIFARYPKAKDPGSRECSSQLFSGRGMIRSSSGSNNTFMARSWNAKGQRIKRQLNPQLPRI